MREIKNPREETKALAARIDRALELLGRPKRATTKQLRAILPELEGKNNNQISAAMRFLGMTFGGRRNSFYQYSGNHFHAWLREQDEIRRLV